MKRKTTLCLIIGIGIIRVGIAFIIGSIQILQTAKKLIELFPFAESTQRSKGRKPHAKYATKHVGVLWWNLFRFKSYSFHICVAPYRGNKNTRQKWIYNVKIQIKLKTINYKGYCRIFFSPKMAARGHNFWKVLIQLFEAR